MDQAFNQNKNSKKKLSQYSLGEYPYIDDSILKGGYRVVRTIKERDKIDCCHKKVGMKVMVIGQDLSFKEYTLKGDGKCSTSYWEESGEGGLSSVDETQVSLVEDYTELGDVPVNQRDLNLLIKGYLIRLEQEKANVDASNVRDYVEEWQNVLAIPKYTGIVVVGEITASTDTVFLGLPNLGVNRVYIENILYTTNTPQQFSYTPVTFGRKFLVVYATASPEVFHLAEGIEGVEAVEPPYDGLFISRLLVTVEGVIENNGDVNKANRDASNITPYATDWRDNLDLYNRSETDSKFSNNDNESLTILEEPILTGNILTLRYKGETGVTQEVNVDLSNLATIDVKIEDATYNASTNIITLTDTEGIEFNIDLSEFSLLVTTNQLGIATLTQEGVTKLQISKVGQTGDYNDLMNKPTIPEIVPQEQSDWNATSGVSFIKNKPTIPAPVDISGKLDKPPTPNNVPTRVVNADNSTSDKGDFQLSEQIEISTNQTAQDSWKGKEIWVTASCTLTIPVPSALSAGWNIDILVFPSVMLTMAITSGGTWLHTTPTTVSDAFFRIARRGNTTTFKTLGL